MESKSLFILSAPSGAGKTTIARHLLAKFPDLTFSVSATTRPQREGEIHGKDYFFLTRSEFEAKIVQGDLVEFEEIFGNYYGTLRSEIQRAVADGKKLIFDVDVRGALSLQKHFPADSLLLFISPPSYEILRTRLVSRNTESEEQLQLRLERAKLEMDELKKFDIVIVNDDLQTALEEAEHITQSYLR